MHKSRSPSAGVHLIDHEGTALAVSSSNRHCSILAIVFAARTLLIAAVAAAGASCDTQPSSSAVSLSHMEPATSGLAQRTTVSINGEGFHIPLRSDLATTEVTTDQPTASLGSTELENLVFRNDRLIEAVVPASLPEGTYSLSLTLGEETIELADAFAVIAQRDGGVDGVDASVGRSSDLCRLTPADCEDGQAGAFCSSDLDCQGTCCQDSTNCASGMCSFSCQDSTQCPADMACVHDTCFYRCTQDIDCAPGQSCEHAGTICEWP